MSFCRWSDDDFSSDVYCYEHVHGGFVIHVAKNLVVFGEPLPPMPDPASMTVQDRLRRMTRVSRMLEDARYESIGLAHDGETFNEIDAAAAADRLKYLQGLGYRVPQRAIDALMKEARDAG